MAYVAEESVWKEGVYQLEITDRVLGGPDGISNQPSKDLACRTLFLYDQLAGVWQVISGRTIHEMICSGYTAGETLILPSEYEVGSNTLLLFTEATGLISQAYITEVGEEGDVSTEVTLTFDIPPGILITQVVLASGSSTVSGVPDELMNELHQTITKSKELAEYLESYIENNPVFSPDAVGVEGLSMSLSSASINNFVTGVLSTEYKLAGSETVSAASAEADEETSETASTDVSEAASTSVSESTNTSESENVAVSTTTTESETKTKSSKKSAK